MKKKIARIVAYEFDEPIIGRNGDTRKIEQACIFYEDGSMENILINNSEWDDITRHVYRKNFLEYSEKAIMDHNPEFTTIVQKMRNGTYDENDRSNYYAAVDDAYDNKKILIDTTGKDFADNFEKYVPEMKVRQSTKEVDDNSSTKKTSILRHVKNLFAAPFETFKNVVGDKYYKISKKSKTGKVKEEKKSGMIKKIWEKHPKICLTVAGFLVLFGARQVDKIQRNHSTKKGVIQSWSTNNKENKEVENENIEYSNLYMDELIEVTNHDKTRMVQDSIWKYLNYANDSLAEKLLEKGKTSRFMLKYKEVLASYLAYNADFLYQDDINHIAGNTKLAKKELVNAFDSASKEEALAYVASKKTIDKSMLFQTEEGKEFHKKYAKLVANMAIAESKKEKEKAAKSFHKALKQEMAEMNKEKVQEDRVASYKASIIPIVKAAEMICKRDHLDPILSEKEQRNLNNLLVEEQVKEDFKEFTRDLDNYQTAVDALNKTMEITKSDPDLEDFELAAEVELTAEGIYNEMDRDISDHTVFKSAPVEKDTKSSKKSSTKKTSSAASEKDEKKPKIISTEIKTSEEKIETNTIKETEDENVKNQQQGEAQAEEKRQEMQTEEDNKKEQLEEEVEGMDQEYQENLDNTNHSEKTTDEDLGHGTEITDENKEEDGSISNSVEEITTDEENSTSVPLPNPEDLENDDSYIESEDAPNIIEEEVPIDQIADEIINQMAQAPQEVEKVLTKSM